MTGRFSKQLEVAVNVALLCASLAVAVVAVKRFWLPPQSLSQPTVGARLTLKGADWASARENLVLVLSAGCRYCSESAEFYQRLVPAASDAKLHVLAVLPQPPSEGRAYLDGLGVSIKDVFQSSLSSIDSIATPTLLLVDQNGRIQKAWVGKLSTDAERQVLGSLR